MPLYQIVHQDGASTCTVALSPTHAANEVAAYLYAKMISPNLSSVRRLHPLDRVICKERGEDLRARDVVEAPFDVFMLKEET